MTDIYERLISEVRLNWHPDDASGACIDADLGMEAAKEIEQLRQRVQELTAERDDLLAAAEAIEIDAEECLDFDECTAMLVPIDTYHKLMEAIASVKDKS